MAEKNLDSQKALVMENAELRTQLALNRDVLRDVEDFFTNDVYYSFVNIFSILMFMFVTGVLGFHVLKKYKNPFTGKKINEKKVDTAAKWILIFLWLLLLITECIKVDQKLKKPKPVV